MILAPTGLFQAGYDSLRSSILPMLDALGLSRINIINTGIPVVQANNGTVATNGIVTLGTALTNIFAKCWMWFPAAAVVGGAAGLYYVKMTSTTVGQVFTPYVAPAASGFFPYDPEVASTWNGTAQVLVNAVGSNSAYTNVVAVDNVLVRILIPAGSLGVNGQVRVDALMSGNNSAGVKTNKIKFGATTIGSAAPTTDIVGSLSAKIQNRGIANSQIFMSRTFVAAAVASAVGIAANDTATAMTLDLTGQVAVATDSIIIDTASIEIIVNG